jgi:hypothetical protein
MHVGILPVSWFVSTNKDSNIVRLHSVSGREPSNLLSERYRPRSKDPDARPIMVGTGPVKAFELRNKVSVKSDTTVSDS